MTSRGRLLAAVLLLAPVAFACGKKEQQPPVATQPASTTPGAAATESPAVASSAAATPTTPAPPAATAAPKAPVTTQATQPQAAPPPAATISAPPPTTQAENPAATQPAAPARPAAERPRGKVTLPAKLGAVIFEHENHAGKLGIACTTCHHPSRPEKPQASENLACRGCHTMPAAPPMKTSLQAAFHDPRGATGTCIDCHRQRGGSAPVKCLECHRKK